jgi:hypothetical protein
MATEKKEKKALITKEQLGIDAINIGMTAVGMVVGNVLTNLPIENKLAKSGIVTAAGVGALLINSPKAVKFTKPFAYGLVTFGVVSLIRAALVGDSVTTPGQAGIAGIGNSEKVQKVVNLLLPNLGNSNPVSVSNFGDHVFDIEERMIEDQEAEVMNGFDDLTVDGPGNAFDNLAA